MEREVKDATERVGQFVMRVEAAASTSQFLEKWNRRAEVLAAWLLEQWRQEHATNDAA